MVLPLPLNLQKMLGVCRRTALPVAGRLSNLIAVAVKD